MCHTIRDAPNQDPFQPRLVRVRNQFTGPEGDVLRARSSLELCLPSLKRHEGPPPQEAELPRISHYKCYVAVQESPRFVARDVLAQDQFGVTHARVVSPTRLCNPAVKDNSPIHTEEHLVCYPLRFRVFTRHQFGDLRIDDQLRRTLCVPSEKEEIVD